MSITSNQIKSIKDEVEIEGIFKVKRIGNNGGGALFHLMQMIEGKERSLTIGRAQEISEYLNERIEKLSV